MIDTLKLMNSRIQLVESRNFLQYIPVFSDTPSTPPPECFRDDVYLIFNSFQEIQLPSASSIPLKHGEPISAVDQVVNRLNYSPTDFCSCTTQLFLILPSYLMHEEFNPISPC